MERLQMMALMTTKGISQTKIAEIFGVSKQRIGQILDKAANEGIPVVRRQIKRQICPSCGAENRKKSKGGFCSRECRLKVKPPKCGGPASTIQMAVFVCDGCGIKFSRTNRLDYIGRKTAERRGKVPKRKFCTRECYLKNGVSRKCRN